MQSLTSSPNRTSRAYQVPEEDIANYYKLGYIVFRRLLPASLISDLRREAAKGLELARKPGPHGGRDVQRLQPVSKYGEHINLQPFRDYEELPALQEALEQAFSPSHYVGGVSHTPGLGIFYNPSELPWSMNWHRDLTADISRLEVEDFQALMLDWDAVNQINCALYEDHCTWFVPGSHLRIHNLASEKLVVEPDGRPKLWERGSKITDAVEKELICADYVRSIPGAVQLHLGPGDLAVYRPIAWHLGNYVTYATRATLLDSLLTKRYADWHQAWFRGETVSWRRNSASPTAV